MLPVLQTMNQINLKTNPRYFMIGISAADGLKERKREQSESEREGEKAEVSSSDSFYSLIYCPLKRGNKLAYCVSFRLIGLDKKFVSLRQTFYFSLSGER